MFKKQLSFLLVLALIIASLPLTSFGLYDEKSDDELIKIMEKQGYSESIDKGLGNTYYLNPNVYREQQVIVYSADSGYGDLRSSLPENQPASKNRDKNGNWRVLGYNKNRTVVYNDKYVPDVKPYSGSLASRHWIKSKSAKKSWNTVDAEIARYMLADVRVEVDAAVGTDTVVNILGGTSVGRAKSYAICQAIPGLRSDGTIKMYHQTASGSTLYWTFRVPELGAQLYSTIDVEKIVDKKVEHGETFTVNVPIAHQVHYSGSASVDGLIDNLYENIEVKLDGNTIDTDSSVLKVSGSGKKDSAVSITLSSDKLTVGTHTVTVIADNCFDSWLNDEKSTPVKDQETFKLIVFEKGNPTGGLKLEPVPQTVIKKPGTVDVKIKLTAELVGVDKNPVSFVYYLNDEMIGMNNQPASQSDSYIVTRTIDSSVLARHDWHGEVRIYTDNMNYVTATDDKFTEVVEKPADATIPKPPTPPRPPSYNPMVSIDVPDVVTIGQVFDVTSSATDLDGSIRNVWYETPADAVIDEALSPTSGKMHIDKTGYYEVAINATDNDGDESRANDHVFVVADTPKAKIDVFGKLKVNRKIKITGENSTGTSRSPLDSTKTTLRLVPLDGQANNQLYVGKNQTAIVAGALSHTGTDTIYLQTPIQGRVNIILTVYNTFGESSTAEREIFIQPDVAPVASVVAPEKNYRLESNAAAVADIYNTSASEDGDLLDKVTFIRLIDTNNDNQYDDEIVEVFNGTQFMKTTLKGNQIEENKVSLYESYSIGKNQIPSVTYNVGHVRYEVVVAEDYQDRLYGYLDKNDIVYTSYNDDKQQKITDTDNIKPVADLDISSKASSENIDLVVMTDYTDGDLLALKGKVNSLVSELIAHNKAVQVHYVTQLHDVGTQHITKVGNGYARVIDISYEAKGTFISDYRGEESFYREEDIDETEHLKVYWEYLESETAPTIADFKRSSNIDYTKKATIEEYSQYGTDYRKYYYNLLFKDLNNPMNTATAEAVYYKFSYQPDPILVNDYTISRNKMIDTLTVNFDKVNKWTLVKTYDIDKEAPVKSLLLSDVKKLHFKEDSKKILLVASKGHNYTDYTLNNSHYHFSGLKKTDVNFLIDKKFDVWVEAPTATLDVMFSNKQSGTTINTQDVSLRYLSTVGQNGGLIKDLAEDLNYLKKAHLSNLAGDISINNNTLVIHLTENIGEYEDVDADIFADITTKDGTAVKDIEIENVAYTKDIPRVLGGVGMYRIDEGRQFIKLGKAADQNHFVYHVYDTAVNATTFQLDQVINWQPIETETAINLRRGQYLAIAEVNVNNQMKRLTIKEVK